MLTKVFFTTNIHAQRHFSCQYFICCVSCIIFYWQVHLSVTNNVPFFWCSHQSFKQMCVLSVFFFVAYLFAVHLFTVHLFTVYLFSVAMEACKDCPGKCQVHVKVTQSTGTCCVNQLVRGSRHLWPCLLQSAALAKWDNRWQPGCHSSWPTRGHYSVSQVEHTSACVGVDSSTGRSTALSHHQTMTAKQTLLPSPPAGHCRCQTGFWFTSTCATKTYD